MKVQLLRPDMSGGASAGGLYCIQEGADTFYPVYDARANITGYLDGTGSIVASYAYDPFGQLMTRTGSKATSLPFGFSTQYTDAESGLVYYGMRYYHPKQGRFINRDPISEAGGLNLYSLVSNNPTNGWDILGMKSAYSIQMDGGGTDVAGHSSEWLSRAFSYERVDNGAVISLILTFADICRNERKRNEEIRRSRGIIFDDAPISLPRFEVIAQPVPPFDTSTNTGGVSAFPNNFWNSSFGSAPNSADLTFNYRLGSLPSLNLTPSTTVRVSVWNDEASALSAGHVMVTDMGGNVILSQFPSGGAATAATNQHDNTTFSPAQTFRAENRAPNIVVVTTLPDARGFFSAAVDHRTRADWSPNPSTRDETNCAWAAYNALRGGGVNLPVYTDDMMPRTVGTDLLNAARNNNNNIIVIQPRPGGG